jgi:RNA polymerase sigma factor (sigma-70 family)
MVSSRQNVLTERSNIRSLLELWQTLYKELLFLDCAHVVDEVVTAHEKFASLPEIEDLKQDAQTRLWEFIDAAVKPPTDFKKTARRVIDSQLRNTRRSSSNQQRVIFKLKQLSTTDLKLSPSQLLEQQEMLQVVNKAYRNLNQPLAEVLERLTGLGDFEEHGVNELAALKSVTRQTIRNWKNRAYEELKQDSELQDLAP